MLYKKFFNLQTIGFLLIAILSLVIYYPSFLHIARAEQTLYLAEVAPKTDLASLTIKNYNFNRTRIFNPGDVQLFRPLMYIFLGIEKYFFGLNFFWWQLTGFIIHLIVIWLLLRLLLTINYSIFAVLLTGVFATLFANMEMVIWHHINAYMLALALIIIALEQIYFFLTEQQPDLKTIFFSASCLLLAALTYELAVLICFCFIFIILMEKWKGKTLNATILLLTPIIIFFFLSKLDLQVNHYNVPQSEDFISTNLDLAKTIKNIMISNIHWFFSGIFPVQMNPIFTIRLMLPFGEDVFTSLKTFEPSVGLGFLLIAAYIAILLTGLRTKEYFKNKKFSLLTLFISLAYSFMIVVGRVNPRGFAVLGTSFYYSYIYWLFFLIFIYSLIDFKTIRTRSLYRMTKILCILLLCLFIALNSLLVYKMNLTIAKVSEPTRKIVTFLNFLIKEQGNKPDFSFYVAENFPGNYPIEVVKKPTDPQDKVYSYIELLYTKYFTFKKPKFTFVPNI